MRRMHLIPAAAGVLVAVAANASFQFTARTEGAATIRVILDEWWLNDGRVRNLIVLAMTALVVGFVGDAKNAVPREIALWLGFVVAMTGVLFGRGPDTMFPGVIAVAASMAAMAILIGAGPALLRR